MPPLIDVLTLALVAAISAALAWAWIRRAMREPPLVDGFLLEVSIVLDGVIGNLYVTRDCLQRSPSAGWQDQWRFSKRIIRSEVGRLQAMKDGPWDRIAFVEALCQRLGEVRTDLTDGTRSFDRAALLEPLVQHHEDLKAVRREFHRLFHRRLNTRGIHKASIWLRAGSRPLAGVV